MSETGREDDGKLNFWFLWGSGVGCAIVTLIAGDLRAAAVAACPAVVFFALAWNSRDEGG